MEKSQELKLRKLIREELKRTRLNENKIMDWDSLLIRASEIFEEGLLDSAILEDLLDKYPALKPKNINKIDDAMADFYKELESIKKQLFKKYLNKHGII